MCTWFSFFFLFGFPPSFLPSFRLTVLQPCTIQVIPLPQLPLPPSNLPSRLNPPPPPRLSFIVLGVKAMVRGMGGGVGLLYTQYINIYAATIILKKRNKGEALSRCKVFFFSVTLIEDYSFGMCKGFNFSLPTKVTKN